MYGATVANLNIYMKQVGKPESLVWNLNGSQVYTFSPTCSLLPCLHYTHPSLISLSWITIFFCSAGQCLAQSRGDSNQQDKLSDNF